MRRGRAVATAIVSEGEALRGCELPNDLWCDIEPAIEPRDLSGVEVENDLESFVACDLFDDRTEFDEKCILGVLLNAHQLGLRILDEPLHVETKLFELGGPLSPGRLAQDAGVLFEQALP